ncbi:MAG: EFR1 family ferrodoxin [Candidatus Hodarchaeota archaeon]
MEITIYFFTGTGNSLIIARNLIEKLEDAELIPIAKIWELESIKTESGKVGFIFPLYWSGLPKIVYDFINKLNLTKTNYIFAIITSAGDINEQPLQQLKKLLKAKGKTLNAGFYITMPSNYIIGYDVDPESRQKELFEKAVNEVESILDIIKFNENNLSKDLFEKDVSRSERINRDFRENVYNSDKAFYVYEQCNGCGTCEDICPVNNIILVKDKPIWQHRCQQCLACINFCPEKAIQFGEQTIKTQRYHHPKITVQDIITQKK